MLADVPVDARRDPLAALAELPGVLPACLAAREEIDQMLWDRTVRANAADIATESRLQGARASAALEGAEVSLAAMRAGIAEEDPPSARRGAAIAVTAAIHARRTHR